MRETTRRIALGDTGKAIRALPGKERLRHEGCICIVRVGAGATEERGWPLSVLAGVPAADGFADCVNIGTRCFKGTFVASAWSYQQSRQKALHRRLVT